MSVTQTKYQTFLACTGYILRVTWLLVGFCDTVELCLQIFMLELILQFMQKSSLQIQPPPIAPGRFGISRERHLRFTAKNSILMTLTANYISGTHAVGLA